MEEKKPEEKKKSNRTAAILITVLSIVVVVQTITIFLDHREKQELRVENASTEEELASTIQRLNEIRAELDARIAEIEKLNGDVTELQAAKEEIDEELTRTRRANGRVIRELRDKVEGYEELLRVKDKEIADLKAVNEELFSENKTLKTRQNVLGDSISRLSRSKEELASKVEIASQLKAENVQIVALNDRGRERESPFRARQIEQLKITFNIAENNVAPIEGKTVRIRIVDENDQLLFDINRGSGTFFFEGKEMFYTASQDFLFDNSRQQLAFLYEKGSEFSPGEYTVEIYCNDYRMGAGQFSVR